MKNMKSKLKLLAQRQLRYANNLMSINAEIDKLLNENNIEHENTNIIYLLTEPTIIYKHLIDIADNYQNCKKFKLDIVNNK